MTEWARDNFTPYLGMSFGEIFASVDDRLTAPASGSPQLARAQARVLRQQVS